MPSHTPNSIFYLKLKGSDGRHCFFCNLEESGIDPSKRFMDVHKAKYAEEYSTIEKAQAFKDKWDNDDSFQIVDSLDA